MPSHVTHSPCRQRRPGRWGKLHRTSLQHTASMGTQIPARHSYSLAGQAHVPPWQSSRPGRSRTSRRSRPARRSCRRTASRSRSRALAGRGPLAGIAALLLLLGTVMVCPLRQSVTFFFFFLRLPAAPVEPGQAQRHRQPAAPGWAAAIRPPPRYERCDQSGSRPWCASNLSPLTTGQRKGGAWGDTSGRSTYFLPYSRWLRRRAAGADEPEERSWAVRRTCAQPGCGTRWWQGRALYGAPVEDQAMPLGPTRGQPRHCQHSIHHRFAEAPYGCEVAARELQMRGHVR